MSYEEFRRRIDTMRQILVGAVPSPAGQIDQITYALMYKFMNDIDDQSAALGGVRTYFTGEYEKYNWHALMSSSLGAHERLELYRQAIQTMAKNENIPELFRSIYQNAFLPFNSANVLTLFLKEADKFSHGETDDIGDAYEYLLSITGAQGDVGQFRTPRHIIKFIAEAVNPTKDDKVLDPAVGTAGFLIAAYNHVLSQHDGKDVHGNTNDEKRLTADELDKIHRNYRGFDIDPTMVRTAKVNMYLHGFKTPDIINHDSLSSEEYWNDRYDVILANPPFMTPKGGIQPHKKFGISANRAEVLFVDYIASHLKPTGRAGIVVPEGIIFQSGKAYKELRKNLVENYLYAVVSLPAGVFQPYSGVKTSVLLFDKELAKQRGEILFVKVENDGYSLGAQRRKITGDQFPDALEVIEKFKAGEEFAADFTHTVSRNEIAESGDYNLSGDRYKVSQLYEHADFPIVSLGEIVKISTGKKDVNEGNPNGKYPFFTCAREHTYADEYSYDQESLLIAGNGDVGNVKYYNGKFEAYQRTYILSGFQDVEPIYLYHILDNTLKATLEKQKLGNTMPYIKMGMLSDHKIPLPPIEIQREIVAELDGYQKIIDAAQTIVQTYKPTIKINPEWEIKQLSEISERVTKGTTPTTAGFEYKDSGINFVKVESITDSGDFIPAKFAHVDNECHQAFKRSQLKAGDVLFSIAGALGRVAEVDPSILPANTNQALSIITPTGDVLPRYLAHVLKSDLIAQTLDGLKVGVAQSNLSLTQVSNFKIPLPPIEIQREIVAELEAEQKLIDANKKLIEIYQQKIKSKIAEVWGE